ncbi:hypothetical protein CYJ40_09430 [Brevibacterium ravenspurgense]|uniref:Uncharacterized protein n=1 Tax=Brevibacterium ravenspurgense TaxID=479117 RepID=A0A2I1IF47_9MICO|nr:hypothetical protein [Brevibacterium ravenspurgense]PKY69756.1 hypothetical protein CYJ40_09430 [Brevibacterium ravenspurgense]
MAEHLILADSQSVRDALTFVGRAAQVNDDGVRVQASRGVLAMLAPALAPRGLFDSTPLILVLRVLNADPELECDLTVETLTESTDPCALRLPEVAVARTWANVEVPHGGWTQTAEISEEVLHDEARAGSADVAHALPLNPGRDVLNKVRGKVWGEPSAALANLPRGVAFASSMFGFLHPTGHSASVWRAVRWFRMSHENGHVLYRGPVAEGLTQIRRTGPRR